MAFLPLKTINSEKLCNRIPVKNNMQVPQYMTIYTHHMHHYSSTTRSK